MKTNPKLSDTYRDVLSEQSDPALEHVVQQLDALYTRAMPPEHLGQSIKQALQQHANDRHGQTQPVQAFPFIGRLAPLLRGGVTVRKGFAFAAIAAVLLLTLLGLFALKSATPVSAQEILDRSYAAQTAANGTQGIQHTRTEVYRNLQASPGSQGGSVAESRTVLESYIDPQTGKFRSVLSDATTGKVTDVSAFDGTYVYRTPSPLQNTSGGALTIYRRALPKGAPQLPQPKPGLGPVDYKSLVNAARKDPTAKVVGQETWPDGRQVYVLQFQRLASAAPVNGQPTNPTTALPSTPSTLYFDVKTFQLLENRQTFLRDGKEIVVRDSRVVVSETLAETAAVAWNLSDLNGVTVVDNPNGAQGAPQPVSISPQELASRTRSAFMLKTVPSGFEMQITASPQQSNGQPVTYAIVYRNQAGDIFRVQGGAPIPETRMQGADEVYKTASGLTLYFEPQGATTAAKMITSAIVQAPGGTVFLLISSLPRERVKALAEELIPVQ